MEFPSNFASVVVAWIFTSIFLLPVLAQPIQSAPSSTNSPSSSNVSSQQITLQDHVEQLWQDHQVSLLLIGVLTGSYLGILWIKPLWLLKLPSADIPVPWTNYKFHYA